MSSAVRITVEFIDVSGRHRKRSQIFTRLPRRYPGPGVHTNWCPRNTYLDTSWGLDELIQTTCEELVTREET